MKQQTRAQKAGQTAAFAAPEVWADTEQTTRENIGSRGMTLRAWLAGQALAGLSGVDGGEDTLAECAVAVADATLARLYPEPVQGQPGEVWTDGQGTFWRCHAVGVGEVIQTDDDPEDPDGWRVGAIRLVNDDWATRVPDFQPRFFVTDSRPAPQPPAPETLAQIEDLHGGFDSPDLPF